MQPISVQLLQPVSQSSWLPGLQRLWQDDVHGSLLTSNNQAGKKPFASKSPSFLALQRAWLYSEVDGSLEYDVCDSSGSSGDGVLWGGVFAILPIQQVCPG